MVLNDCFENVPDFFVLPFEHLLRALDGISVTHLLELADDERLVKFEGDFLGQTTLVEPQRRSDNDHTTCRIVDSLSEQVFAETTLLTLDHIGERLEWPIATTEYRSLATVVVEQGVDGLLQHSLFVANDHFRRVQVDKLSQSIVSVDDSSIEIVQIARGKVGLPFIVPRLSGAKDSMTNDIYEVAPENLPQPCEPQLGPNP